MPGIKETAVSLLLGRLPLGSLLTEDVGIIASNDPS